MSPQTGSAEFYSCTFSTLTCFLWPTYGSLKTGLFKAQSWKTLKSLSRLDQTLYTGHFIRSTLRLPPFYLQSTALNLWDVNLAIDLSASHKITRSTTSQITCIGLRSSHGGTHCSEMDSSFCLRGQDKMIWVLWDAALSWWIMQALLKPYSYGNMRNIGKCCITL